MRQGFRPVRTDAKPSSWIKNRPLLSFLALMMGSVLAAAGLAPSAMGNAQRKPDLVVTSAAKGGGAYAFKGDAATLSFQDVTKNLKKRGHDATAGPSRTKMFLVPSHSGPKEPRVGLASRRVPKLRPDHSDGGTASGAVSTDTLPVGAYKVKVCADATKQVKERNEDNNCKRAGNFYVVQKSWHGGVRGVGVAAGAAGAEKWHSSGAHLNFSVYLGHGRFFYLFGGTVEWNDSGVNSGGCTVSGHGEKDFHGWNDVTLDYLAGTYDGVLHTGHFYPISLTGSGGGFPCSGTAPGPATRNFLDMGDPKSLTFDQNELKGTFSTGAGEGATWRWDFF